MFAASHTQLLPAWSFDQQSALPMRRNTGQPYPQPHQRPAAFGPQRQR